MRPRPLALFAICAALAGPVWAACPGQTQLEMNECASMAYQAADAKLNAAWPAARAAMEGAGAGPQLLDAQRKWIAFRDAACGTEQAAFQGGSIAPLIYFECMRRLTERRTQDLRALAN